MTSAAPAPRLIVSSHGTESRPFGGVFAVGEGGHEQLDPLPTSGMAVSPDGTRLARLTWVDGQDDISELLISDATGLLTYRRLDMVGEPHSLLWLGDELHAVSTATNSIVVMDDAGRAQRTWRAVEGDGDLWHLNSLVVRESRVLVSAFGQFVDPHCWTEPERLDGAGIVLDVASRQVVMSGFSAPHDPTWAGDGWLICNSKTSELWRLDEHGQRIGSVYLGGWTRGVVVDGDVVYVGVSTHRLAAPIERAHVAVLDRTTLHEIGRFLLPGRDVFAVLRYDERLANGLRVGTNQGVQRQLGSPITRIDAPLPASDSLAGLELIEATATSVTVRMTNHSTTIVSSFGTHPVRLGARWRESPSAAWTDIGRADLRTPLYPHDEAILRVDLDSVPPPGATLQICVLQEGVRWFDEVNPAAAIDISAA